MNKVSIGNLIIALVLGLFIGAVAGAILDKVLGTVIFSMNLFKDPVLLELYIIKVEVQLTPASLIGLVVTGYLVLKKG
ncbi:MAG: hypothetical protein IT569_02790 [Leptospiraceae bacterium]|nr:hypothetical protein [Leptospiraceae bacterium]